MGRTKYDGDALGREYATVRAAAGGVMTQEAFFKSKRIPVGYGRRKFGPVLSTYWDRTRAAAEAETTKRNGINMARELSDLYKQHKELVRRGYAKLTAPGPDGKEALPADAEEALALFQQGSIGATAIMKILSGGQAVLPPTNVEPEFRWNEPTQPNKKKRKTKRAGR